MTEAEARAWVAARWPAQAIDRLDRYEALVRAEVPKQNLVAPSTLDHFWARHVVDSAQLVEIARDHAPDGDWVDIGSGAGMPGIVAAILQPRPLRLVEPRRRRADFLAAATLALGLDATVVQSRIETVAGPTAAILSARAVAELSALIAAALHLADRSTLWLLPKGRGARSEVAAAVATWHGVFHVEHSITAADSLIVVARGIEAR